MTDWNRFFVYIHGYIDSNEILALLMSYLYFNFLKIDY